MRKALCEALTRICSKPEFVFLTGDLGYKALEPLREKAGERFINAGIAEQNMVSVAAGLARSGFKPWVYSIAPFIYARPLEQIRNDLSLHDLPVKLVGNGGGYAYGVMGSSHHAIEDYGILLSLSHLQVFVPVFEEDIPAVVEKLGDCPHPAYLRLGQDEKPEGWKAPAYAPWRKILEGSKAALLVVGPLAGLLVSAFQKLDDSLRPALWALSELPLDAQGLPGEFLEDIRRSGHLMVAEEHVAHGSAGEMIGLRLLLTGEAPRRFTHACARGYPSGTYGSQAFHRKESGLTPEDILKGLEP